jgi:hypothetical protein
MGMGIDARLTARLRDICLRGAARLIALLDEAR